LSSRPSSFGDAPGGGRGLSSPHGGAPTNSEFARAQESATRAHRLVTNEPTTSGLAAAKGAAVTLTITLDEDFDALCGTRADEQRLREAIIRDLSTSLHANASRFEIKDLKRGSIVITILVHPDPLAQDPRSSQQLAAQVTALANDPSSILRNKPALRALTKIESGDGQLTAAAAPIRDSTMAGVGLQFEVTRNPRGVLVAIVTKLLADGPAAASGLVQVGDTIVACDGQACEGKSIEEIASLILGLKGSLCRLTLKGPGVDAPPRTCSLVRRPVVTRVGPGDVVGAKSHGRLSDAADIIADSFKSPAYRKATTQNTPSNFTETYIKTSQKVASAPAQPKPPPEQPQSPLLPRRLVVLASPGLQSVDMDRTAQPSQPAHPQQQPPKSAGPSPGLSPARQTQAEAEARLRAQVAIAEKQAQEEARALEARAQEQRAASLGQAPRAHVPLEITPKEPGSGEVVLQRAESRRALRSAPAPGAPQPPAPAAQVQRQLLQQKINAIKPAPPPQAGTPKVVATVLGARNLPVTEKFGVATPYVIMAIGNSFHKTTPAQSAADPTWGETFEFAVQPALMQGMLLTLTVEDLSAALRDEPVGQLSIPLLQLMSRKTWEGWFDLRTIKSVGPITGVAAVQLRLSYVNPAAGTMS